MAYILTRRSPTRLLVSYYVGGFGVSLIIGGVIVFALDGASIGKSSSFPPEVEIAVGALALLVAALVVITHSVRDSLLIGARVRNKVQPHTLESVPGFEKLLAIALS